MFVKAQIEMSQYEFTITLLIFLTNSHSDTDSYTDSGTEFT